MNRFLVLLMSVLLALPAQALDLQGLYEQALTACRQGLLVEPLQVESLHRQGKYQTQQQDEEPVHAASDR